MTALGVGVAATAADNPIALPLVAVLTSVLWMRYIDHVVAVFRVAAYITCRLRPRLRRELGDPGLFMWEEFLRSEGRPGRAPGPWLPAMNTRAGSPTLDRLKKAIGPGQDSRKGTLVASVAFFLPPPLMFGYYVFHLLSTGAFSVWPMFLVVTALLTWLYASLHVWRTTSWISDIDEMIMGYVGMKAPDRPGTTHGHTRWLPAWRDIRPDTRREASPSRGEPQPDDNRDAGTLQS